MKINIKNILSDYNTDTGESVVTIATDIGEFTGFAQLHPDDKDIESKYAGCRYAEMRAGIQYMKQKARIANYKLQELYKIYKDLTQRHNCNMDNIGMRVLQKEIYMLEDEKEFFNHNAYTLTTRLTEAINSRPDTIKYILEKEKNKEKDND